jgi:hypothetical protein
MCSAIDNPGSSKIRAVIHILQAKNMSATEIVVNYARFVAKM